MSNRMCGAAALCMVYRSFGLTASQAELWPKIARRSATRQLGARTYLLAQDALQRGLGALVIQAHDPVAILRRCLDNSLRAILNHRLDLELPTGHYTVLVGLTEQHVLLHDPQVGPSTRLLLYDLLKLWQPSAGLSEITGRVLVALAQSKSVQPPCNVCGSVIPETVPCPSCKQAIPLQPAAALGCAGADCPARMWEMIFCPFCDTALRSTAAGRTNFIPGADGEKSPVDPLNLKGVHSAVDSLCERLMASPGAAADPRIAELVGVLKEQQAGLREYEAKEKSKPMEPAAPPRKAEQPAKPAPAAPPPPPELLNGNVIGRSLLKELGLHVEEDQGPIELPEELKPVKKEAPPPKKEPAKITDHELVRKAMQKPAKPGADENFSSLKME
jgi:hypothetical protein